MIRRPDGTFVIAGSDLPEVGTSLLNTEGSILCVTSTGQADHSCAGSGRWTTSIDAGDDGFWDIEIDDRGRLIVSGFASSPSSSFVSPSPFVMRLRPDLTPDADFGTGGIVMIPSNSGHIFGLARDPRGRILAAGIEFTGVVSEARVIRLDSANAPTTTLAPAPTAIAPSLLPATGGNASNSWPVIMMGVGLGLFLVRRFAIGHSAK
jgi:hypothetical protein